ncbi:MAG: adenosylcobinamide-GDP ribazoletransferase [Chloroflexota bacterium]
MGFFIALQFLTVLPPAVRRPISAAELARSQAYFPLVGLFLGVLLALLDLGLRAFLPAALASGLLVVALVLLTGALHLDGFMDTLDGLFGRREPAQRLEVMKDSRAGSFGVIGVWCLLLLKYLALLSLGEGWRFGALVAIPTLSRWGMAYAIWAFPYARPQGTGHAFKEGAGWGKLLLASLAALAVAALALGSYGIALFLLAGLAVWLTGRYLVGKLGGLTGDTYGALNEVLETGGLLLLVALPGLPQLFPPLGGWL